MSAMASQITSLTIVYSTVYSGTHQRKHQSFTSLAFVRGIHRWPGNSPHKGPITRKMFPFDDVIMHPDPSHHPIYLFPLFRSTSRHATDYIMVTSYECLIYFSGQSIVCSKLIHANNKSGVIVYVGQLYSKSVDCWCFEAIWKRNMHTKYACYPIAILFFLFRILFLFPANQLIYHWVYSLDSNEIASILSGKNKKNWS